MTYSTPELVVLGPAQVLVLGAEPGMYDNLVSELSRPPADMSVGLDD
jgi:hypothetical protein